ncbi:MAG: hypothetical protein AB7O59_12285 [Pirellulales bacterium]
MGLVTVNRHPSPRQVRQFALVWLSGALLVAAAVAGVRYGAWLVAGLLAGGAVLSVAIGIIRPGWMRPVFVAFVWATLPFGWVVAHVLLATIYYGMIVPLGLGMKLIGRDPLERRFDREAASYWLPCEPQPERARYFRPY